MRYTLLIFTILFVFSMEGGDQQCCYGPTGELLPYAKGGGSVSRFSATHQPLLNMLRDVWPRIMCDQLAKQSSAYQQLRPTDDCSGYVSPKQGVLIYEYKILCNMLFDTLATYRLGYVGTIYEVNSFKFTPVQDLESG